MFDTIEPRLVELAEQDLASAKDNLHRAKAAAEGCDSAAPWGEAGATLDDIIAGYEMWAAIALETLEQAKGATR